MPGFKLNPLTADSYNDLPYPSYAYSQTHPDHLATLATMSGMRPPPVENCRVLELGCASGGNILPMAYTLPNAQFVGVDFSSRQVEEGQALLEILGLDNVTLKHLDFMAIDDSLGQFDYIIVYGIFSWVPAEVREKILQICQRHLSANGVAYVSYNAYPGWHMYGTVRDLMIFHSRDTVDPVKRVSRGREFIRFLAEEVPTEGHPYGHLMIQAHHILKSSEDGYIRHDFLAEENTPYYFIDFLEVARRHNLQYLANGQLHDMINLPAEVMEKIFSFSDDIVTIEQYLDLVRNQTFRQTLLCHADVTVERTVDAAAIANLRVSTRTKADELALHLNTDEPEAVGMSSGGPLNVSHPLTKAVISLLAANVPRTLPFDELVRAATQAVYPAIDSSGRFVDYRDIQTLAANLVWLYNENTAIVRFHTVDPPIVTEISRQPLAGLTSRYQAERNLPVTNMYHERVTMEQIPRQLLVYLDGTRDFDALLQIMELSLTQGLLEITVGGQIVKDPEAARPALRRVLNQTLQNFVASALLVG